MHITPSPGRKDTAQSHGESEESSTKELLPKCGQSFRKPQRMLWSPGARKSGIPVLEATECSCLEKAASWELWLLWGKRLIYNDPAGGELGSSIPGFLSPPASGPALVLHGHNPQEVRWQQSLLVWCMVPVDQAPEGTAPVEKGNA